MFKSIVGHNLRSPSSDAWFCIFFGTSNEVARSDLLTYASHFVQLFNCHQASVLAGVGQARFELATPRLSSACSNQLSYWPKRRFRSPSQDRIASRPSDTSIDRNRLGTRPRHDSRKEVIQPQVPLRLPCYDFTPVTSHSLGGCLTRLAHRLLEQLTPMV